MSETAPATAIRARDLSARRTMRQAIPENHPENDPGINSANDAVAHQARHGRRNIYANPEPLLGRSS